MIRHISVFTFRKVGPDGSLRADNLQKLRDYLADFPARYPAIRRQQLAVPAFPTPDLPEEAPVLFGDLIQILDFDTVEDAAGYPDSEAHTSLGPIFTPLLRKVTAIDYEIE